MTTTTATTATELGIDLTDRELYRHGFPHERLSFLRDEPVWWHPLTPGVEELRPTGFYVVARHDVVREVSRDPQRFTAYHGSSLGDVVPERRGRVDRELRPAGAEPVPAPGEPRLHARGWSPGSTR